MNNEKNKFTQRAETLAKNHRENKTQELPDDIKLCPFQSTPDCEIPCTPRCSLFRGNKPRGFECPLAELTSISWQLAGKPQANNSDYRRPRQN